MQFVLCECTSPACVLIMCGNAVIGSDSCAHASKQCANVCLVRFFSHHTLHHICGLWSSSADLIMCIQYTNLKTVRYTQYPFFWWGNMCNMRVSFALCPSFWCRLVPSWACIRCCWLRRRSSYPRRVGVSTFITNASVRMNRARLAIMDITSCRCGVGGGDGATAFYSLTIWHRVSVTYWTRVSGAVIFSEYKRENCSHMCVLYSIYKCIDLYAIYVAVFLWFMFASSIAKLHIANSPIERECAAHRAQCDAATHSTSPHRIVCSDDVREQQKRYSVVHRTHF